tara:strand:- start:186 stop:449 length:264 start_codon:yes stop_codon:yes gene_type:complete
MVLHRQFWRCIAVLDRNGIFFEHWQIKHGPDEAAALTDIQFGHMLYRYYTIPIARRPLPAVAQYYSRIAQRPAYKTHVMVSFDKLQA